MLGAFPKWQRLCRYEAHQPESPFILSHGDESLYVPFVQCRAFIFAAQRNTSRKMAQYRDSMIVVMVIFLVFNGLAVGARAYSRLRITKSFGADDAMLCLTYVRLQS